MIDYNKFNNFNKLKNILKVKSNELGVNYNYLMSNYIAQCITDRLSKTSWSKNNKVIGGSKFALIMGVNVRTSKDLDIDIYEVNGNIDDVIVRFTNELNEVVPTPFDFIKRIELKSTWLEKENHFKSEKVGKSIIYTVYLGETDESFYDFKVDLALYNEPFTNSNFMTIKSNLVDFDINLNGTSLLHDFYLKTSIIIDSIFIKKRYKDVYDSYIIYKKIGKDEIIKNKDKIFEFVNQEQIDEFLIMFNQLYALDNEMKDWVGEYIKMKNKPPYLQKFNVVSSLKEIASLIEELYGK